MILHILDNEAVVSYLSNKASIRDMVAILTRPPFTNNPVPAELEPNKIAEEHIDNHERSKSRITLYSASGDRESKVQNDLSYNDQAYVNTAKTFPTPDEHVR